jgi:hypothetical protein
MDSHLSHIEQSIAETEMRITMQRALMDRNPYGKRQQSAVMALLHDVLQLKIAIRHDMQWRSINRPLPSRGTL